jgi:hypothetical protein
MLNHPFFSAAVNAQRTDRSYGLLQETLPLARRLANMDTALEIARHRLQMMSRNLATSFS